MTPAAARDLRAGLIRRLLAQPGQPPLSSVVRLGRLAGLGLRTRPQVGAVARAVRGNDGPPVVERTVETLGQLKGVPMKVGQLMSYAPTPMPEAARAALSVLQTHSQPIPWPDLEAAVRAELGPTAPGLLATMERAPLAVASLGQVHRARLPDGTAVAVKVQIPGIEQTVGRDLTPAAVGARVSTWIHREADRAALVHALRTRLVDECDYRLEARRQAQFGEFFAGHPDVIVPDVHARYSARRVLTTALIEGVHLHELLAREPDETARDRAGVALFDYYFRTLFTRGVYNGDAHPGNYLFCADGRVAVVDHGCTRVFERGFVGQLADLTCAVDADDRAAIHDALIALRIVERGQDYDHGAVRRLLHWFYGPMLTDELARFEPDETVEWGELHDARKRVRKLAIPVELVFLVRMRLGLAFSLARLGAHARWRTLQRDAVSAAPREATLSAPISVRERRSFDLVLVDPGDDLIAVLREIRDSLRLSVSEAKALVDAVPRVIKPGLNMRDAHTLRARLEATGARVELREI